MITGEPNERWGHVVLQDVATVLATKGQEDNEADDLYGAYVALVLADSRTPGDARSFGRTLNALGLHRRVVWTGRPELLARRWPRLDWTVPPPQAAEPEDEWVDGASWL